MAKRTEYEKRQLVDLLNKYDDASCRSDEACNDAEIYRSQLQDSGIDPDSPPRWLLDRQAEDFEPYSLDP